MLLFNVKDAQQRLLEWHSHPNNVSLNPSELDIKLHNNLSQQMTSAGLPVLMVIVGENNISFSLSLNL